jgi:hypothetical protein
MINADPLCPRTAQSQSGALAPLPLSLFAKASMRPCAALQYRSRWPHSAAFALRALLVHEPENGGVDSLGHDGDTNRRSVEMPRSRQRICLQEGLKLNINLLIRRGLIASGSATGPQSIRWVNGNGQEIASGSISADMKGDTEGWLHIQIDKFGQRITLSASPCHYGGRKWFFLCPVMNRRASVLWLPRGAQHFASRHAWPGQVAYRSQFMTAMDRAYLGMERIKRRLIGDLDPQNWDPAAKAKMDALADVLPACRAV